MTGLSATGPDESIRLARAQRGAFLGAFIGWLFDYYEVFLLTFLLIPISKDFRLDSAQSAWIVSASLVSMAVGGLVFGMAADRIGRRRVLLATLLLYTLATLARALSPNYVVLLLLSVIAGLGLGGEYGVGQSLVAEMFGARRRGWWSGLFYGGAFFAIMLASLVAGHVLPAIGWRWTFVLSGLPALFAFYLRRHTPESPAWRQAVRQERPDWRVFRSRGFLSRFGKCFVAAALYFWAYYGVTTLLPKYLVSNGFSMSGASWWIFFSAIAGLLGCLAGAWASDALGRRPTLSILMALSTVGALILYAGGHGLMMSRWVLLPFAVMYFGSNAATVFGSLFSEVFPTESRSTGVSTAIQFARGSSAVPPLLASAIIAHHGYMPIFLVSTCLYAAVGLWAWVFPETKGLEIGTIDHAAGGKPAVLSQASSRESTGGS